MPNPNDIAWGDPGPPPIRIAGRPRAGTVETYAILEEPGEPVQLHFVEELGASRPHYRRNCPYCDGADTPSPAPAPYWYIGAAVIPSAKLVILELTRTCFETLAASARHFTEGEGPSIFRGLRVQVGRRGYEKSPRWLRCERRVSVDGVEWRLNTRAELCRIWRIPTAPRLYRVEGE